MTEPTQKGYLVTFEGGEGTGKSTHIGLVKSFLTSEGYEVVVLREPGGTAVGESLRAVVLDPTFEDFSDRAELFCYEAARAQLVHEVIAPALSRGAIVLCDRFTDSTVAYQGFGRGLDRTFIRVANDYATGGIRPDKTFLLVCESPETGLYRATKDMGADRLEQAGLSFHERVNRGFMELAAEEPERITIVDTSKPKPEVAFRILEALRDFFPWMEERSGNVSGGEVRPLSASTITYVETYFKEQEDTKAQAPQPPMSCGEQEPES